MASERISRALMSIGDDLGAMAGVALDRERAEADRIHQESLVRLRGQIDANLSEASDKREFEFRSGETEADRKYRSAEADKDRKASASENAKDRALTSRRMDDQELRSVEQSTTQLVDRIDKRILSLRDQLRELQADSLGSVDPAIERDITGEINELMMSRNQARYRMFEQLQAMDDPRVQGADTSELLRRSGYSERQIQLLQQLDAQQSGEAGQPGEEPKTVIADEIIQRPQRRRSRSKSRQLMQQAEDDLSAATAPAGGALSDTLVLGPAIDMLRSSPVFNSDVRAANRKKAEDFMARQDRSLMAGE